MKRMGLALVTSVALLALVVSVAVLDAGYGFQRVGRMVGQISFRSEPLQAVAGLLPDRMLLPLPEDFLRAFDLQLFDAQHGDPSFLLGESYTGGRWTYFPVLLLTKVPLPLLLLAGLALGVRVAGRRRGAGALPLYRYARLTSTACRPLGPFSTSKVTA